MNRLSKEEIFQWRLTAVASGGYLLDGYIIGIIGPVIVAMGTQMQINVFWSGLLGSSILVGLFFGAIVFGYITDKLGRRRLMILNSLAFIIISVLQFFVDNPFQLVQWLLR
jgi:putative MFS transporter